MTKTAAINFIGDSHLDISAMYFKGLEIDAAFVRPSEAIVKDVRGRHLAVFLTELRKVVRRHNDIAQGQRTVILVDIGLHDICGGGLGHFANKVLPTVIRELSDMQAKRSLENIHFIFVSIVALPPNATPRSYHRVANTAAGTAMSRLLVDSLTKARINVTFVNYLEIVRPFVNKTSYFADHHYFNYNRTHTIGKKQIVYGAVGLSLANYLLSLVCA